MPRWVPFLQTLLIGAVGLYVGVKTGLWDQFFIAAVLSPVVLLRTPRSTALGVYWFRRVCRSHQRRLIDFVGIVRSSDRASVEGDKPVSIFAMGFYNIWWWLSLAVIAVLIRLAATLKVLCERPLYTLRHIPINWYDSVFRTGVFSRVELMPGTEYIPYSVPNALPRLTHRGAAVAAMIAIMGCFLLPYVQRHLPPSSSLVLGEWDYNKLMAFLYSAMWVCTVMALSFLVPYITALFFRCSIKLSFFVWWPLASTLATAFDDSLTPAERAAEITTVARHRLVRMMSGLVLAGLVAKGVILFLQAEVRVLLQRYPALLPLDVAVQHSTITVWQVTGGLSAFLVWWLYLYCDGVRFRAGTSRPVEERSVRRVIEGTSSVIAFLSWYTTLCTAYVAWLLATSVKWPIVDFVVFPWGRMPPP